MIRHPLRYYFLFAYAGTWGIALLYFFFPEPLESLFGELNVFNPIYFLAVYMPAISALIVIWKKYGFKGCVDGLKRIIQWEKGFRYFIYLVLFFVVYYISMRLVSPLWNADVPSVPYNWYMLLQMAVFFLFADAGPIGEEFGWSGLALPLLQRKYNMLVSGIILGIIWVIWHTPAFFIASLNQSAYSFLGFLFCLTCLRIFMVVVFNVSNGSVLAAIVMHWFNNLDTYLNLTGSSVISSYVTGAIYLSAATIVFLVKRPKQFVNPLPYWTNDTTSAQVLLKK